MGTQLHARPQGGGRPDGAGTSARRFVDRLVTVYPLAFVTDPEARVDWASDAWSTLASSLRGPGDDPRQSVSELCRRCELPSTLERMRAKGGLLRSLVELSGGDGSAQPLELSLFSIGSGGDGEACNIAVARPAAAPPREAPERLTVLDSAPQALLAVDAQGFVTYANVAAEELLHFEPDSLEGHALAALAIDAEGLEALLRAFESGGRQEFALALRGGHGGTVSAVATAGPHRRCGGHTEGLVLSLREAARGPETELARRNQELEHCVNTLAHDLRSPLVALLGFSRLLRQDYGERLDETGAHFLDRIEQAGRTMESLIHDLLELSRIGKPGERARLIDPRAVLLQLSAELKPRLDAQDLRLVLPDNPPLLFCDRTRLYQVFSNLIENAVDHMGDCADRSIHVEIAQQADCNVVTVRDHGRGIAPENREKIFEVFQTLGSGRDGRRGTGMGLAIVRRIAETHQGRAWVESRPGEGAAFHVTFPRR
jgi:signal transduction histidine kinase